MKSLLYILAILATAACGLPFISVIIGMAWIISGVTDRLERIFGDDVEELEPAAPPPAPRKPIPPRQIVGNVTVYNLDHYRKRTH